MSNLNRTVLMDKFRADLIKYYDDEVSLIPDGAPAFCNTLAQVCGEIIRQDAPSEAAPEIISSYTLVVIGATFSNSRAKAIEALLYNMLHLIALVKGEVSKTQFLHEVADAWDDECTRPHLQQE